MCLSGSFIEAKSTNSSLLRPRINLMNTTDVNGVVATTNNVRLMDEICVIEQRLLFLYFS